MIKQFALAGCMAIAVAAQAQAANYTYEFSATITSVHSVTSMYGGPELSSSLGPDGVSIIKAGHGIVGRFSFDDTVVPNTWESGGIEWFDYRSGATLSYTFVNSGATWSGAAEISIASRTMDFWSTDDFVLNGVSNNGTWDGGQLRLYDESDTLFTSGLPRKTFTRGDLSGASMNEAWWLADGQLVAYDARVTSVTFVPAPVPEPAIWGLMLAGLGVLGFAARRTRD